MNLPKNVNNKIWAPKLIFFINKKKYIRMISDKENWLWTATNTDLSSLSTLTEKVQKNFQCNSFDQWTIGFTMKNFYQVPLTLWKTYQGLYKWKWCCDTHCFDLSCCFWRGQSKSECACDGKLKRSRLQTSKTWNMWTCLHESSNDKVRQNLTFIRVCNRKT